MYRSTGVFRRRSNNAFLLKKRLSRKPQTTTAPTPPSFVVSWARFSTLVVGPAGMGPTNNA